MSVSGVGFRSQFAVQSLVDMRAQLDDLQRQLGTGKKSTTYAGQGLDRGLGVALRSQLSALGTFADASTTIGVRLDLAQLTLTRLGDIGRDARSAALQPAQLKASGQSAAQETARAQLDELLELLNTRSGDRYLFSGRSVDRPAVETTAHVLDGDGARAGLRQIIVERAQADTGADGLGRLVVAPLAGTTVALAEDVAGSPFGLKLAAVNSNLSGATVSGPAGLPPGIAVQLGAGNPNAGESVTVTFDLPDGTREAVTLRASATTPPQAGEFALGATPADTAANLRTALTDAVARVGQTTLPAASAMAAADDFFNIGAGDPPLRVAGPPFASATARVAGTAANTVSWYTGELASDPARASAVAKIDQAISVNYGLRANEEGLRFLVQNVAVFAAATVTPGAAGAQEQYNALAQRVGSALSYPGSTQKVSDIASDIAGTQRTIQAAQERQRQTKGTVEGLLDRIEGVAPEEAAAQILALQTRLQASLQTTSLLYQTSLVNYI